MAIEEGGEGGGVLVRTGNFPDTLDRDIAVRRTGLSFVHSLIVPRGAMILCKVMVAGTSLPTGFGEHCEGFQIVIEVELNPRG